MALCSGTTKAKCPGRVLSGLQGTARKAVRLPPGWTGAENRSGGHVWMFQIQLNLQGLREVTKYHKSLRKYLRTEQKIVEKN